MQVCNWSIFLLLKLSVLLYEQPYEYTSVNKRSTSPTLHNSFLNVSRKSPSALDNKSTTASYLWLISLQFVNGRSSHCFKIHLPIAVAHVSTISKSDTPSLPAAVPTPTSLGNKSKFSTV